MKERWRETEIESDEERGGRMRRMMEGIREEWRQSVKGRVGGKEG